MNIKKTLLVLATMITVGSTAFAGLVPGIDDGCRPGPSGTRICPLK